MTIIISKRDYVLVEKESLNHIVRYDALRVLLAISAERDLELGRLNMKITFLHGEVIQKIHMRILEGVIVDNGQK